MLVVHMNMSLIVLLRNQLAEAMERTEIFTTEIAEIADLVW
jgi:hypothetical protein